MSLDNVELPAFVIQDLFQKTLIDPLRPEKKMAQAQTGQLNFFGGNKQRVILIVKTQEAAFVTDRQLTFLSGILNACKLTLEDVALINIATHPNASYKAISKDLTPMVVIMFGITAGIIQLPFEMPEFQIQSFNNQVYLAAPSLDDLENNKEAKRKLWTALQQIFPL